MWSARRRRDLESQVAPLPFVPGEVSNGEFVPVAPTSRDHWIVMETLRRAEQAARRAGIDRRRFLQSAGGFAVMLGVVNACSGGKTAGSSTTSTSGGTFVTPTEPSDIEECSSALGSQGEFIVDIHTHHVMPAGPWRQNAPDIAAMIQRLVPDGCAAADPFECLDRAHYVQDLFLGSDTTVAMLSDVPNSGPEDAPVPFDDNLATAEFAASLGMGGAPRVLTQSVVAPNFGELPPYLDLMSAQVETGKVAAFKAYTAWGPDQRLRARRPGRGRRAVPRRAVRRVSLGVRTRDDRRSLRSGACDARDEFAHRRARCRRVGGAVGRAGAPLPPRRADVGAPDGLDTLVGMTERRLDV